jgi:uncharacterized protein
MRHRGTVAIMAKAPVAGRVKTRLCPPFSPHDAARLATAALQDTLTAALATRCRRRVVALDGAPGPWLPARFDVLSQPRGGLDVRIAALLRACEGPTIVVGMDTPQLTPRLLDTALGLLDDGADAVLGPALDGGYWLLGLSDPHPGAVIGVPMSSSRTGAAQRDRLDALGLRTAVLPTLRDVDTADDAHAVAALVPASRFATVHRNLHHLRQSDARSVPA